MALGFLFICNGLANPYEATVALFSTMIKSIHVIFNETTSYFIISLLHLFHAYSASCGAQEEGEVLTYKVPALVVDDYCR